MRELEFRKVVLRATIIEFHDMQISLIHWWRAKSRPRPKRIVRYTLNVSNYGNVADQPTIHNHTYDDEQNLVCESGLGSLSTWEIDYALWKGSAASSRLRSHA